MDFTETTGLVSVPAEWRERLRRERVGTEQRHVTQSLVIVMQLPGVTSKRDVSDHSLVEVESIGT